VAPPRNFPESPVGMEKFLCNTGAGAFVGAFYGSVVSAWVNPPTGIDGLAITEGAAPSFAKMWGHVAGNAMIYAAVAAAFTIGESTAAAFQGENDVWAAAAGGFAGGSVLSFRQPNMTHAFGVATAFALTSGLVHLSGGAFMQERERVFERLGTVRP